MRVLQIIDAVLQVVKMIFEIILLIPLPALSGG